jgi:glycosyltransferase involved in cell wall biosynthesis
MTTFLIILITLLIFTNYILFACLKKALAVKAVTAGDAAISVVVAAKNEEKNIAFLINSLAGQEYPKEKYEVIIIDDNSDDNTYSLAKGLISDKPQFSVYKAENKKYAGKKGALDFGISNAKYENILITDADCLPGKEWIKSFSCKFSESYDFIFGHAPFIQGNNLVNKISCFENLRSTVLTFSAAEAGFAYSAAARSFGFKKTAFERIKGYSNTTETLGGDDDLLLREAVKNKMKTGTVYNKQAFVYSSSMNKLESYLRQKSRHTKTSTHYLLSRQLILVLWHGVNLLCFISPLAAVFNPFFLLPFITKVSGDYIIVSVYSNKLGYKFNLAEKIYLQFAYEIFIVINFVNSLLKKDRW